MSTHPPIPSLLIAEQHALEHWQPPSLKTIERWKKHAVITRRDWIGVLHMLERLLAAHPTPDRSADMGALVEKLELAAVDMLLGATLRVRAVELHNAITIIRQHFGKDAA